jgi:pimeloyl-ACP methyl ester carboxylesterase
MKSELLRAGVVALLLAGRGVAFAQTTDATPAKPRIEPPDCVTHAGFDRDLQVPGYKLQTALGSDTCVGFTTAAAQPPADYTGDFYVDEFTDEKLRQRYKDCMADTACAKRVQHQVDARHPPNKEARITDPHALYLLGKPPVGETVDLKAIRRPAFFARAPYKESFAQADAGSWTVEFTAPADPYERLHLKQDTPVKLRGWYLRGAGIANDKGGRTRALVIMSGGGGQRVAAIDDPRDTLYRILPNGETELNDYPNKTSGSVGQRTWRKTADVLYRAGFDVLIFDRRGVGLSTGVADTNTLQQGRDLLAIVASLRSGEGMRALTPKGQPLSGKAAAASIRGTAPATGLPVLFLGSSRGTMASGWAMTMNFDKACHYDLADLDCGPGLGDQTIRGAILFSEFSSGMGYVPAQMTDEDNSRGLGDDRGLFTVGTELQQNIVFFPSSAVLAGIHKWPSLFQARGLWDYAAGLEGSMDSNSRVDGPKELVVVRGPHPYESWPDSEKKRVQERMVAYARAAVLGHKTVPGGRPWTTRKELVATASDVWEPSSDPRRIAALRAKKRD